MVKTLSCAVLALMLLTSCFDMSGAAEWRTVPQDPNSDSDFLIALVADESDHRGEDTFSYLRFEDEALKNASRDLTQESWKSFRWVPFSKDADAESRQGIEALMRDLMPGEAFDKSEGREAGIWLVGVPWLNESIGRPFFSRRDIRAFRVLRGERNDRVFEFSIKPGSRDAWAQFTKRMDGRDSAIVCFGKVLILSRISKDAGATFRLTGREGFSKAQADLLQKCLLVD